MRNRSDFLYARPSFTEGVARVFDIGGTLNEYNTSSTGSEADAIAIRSDWDAIGQDILTAIRMFEAEEQETLARGADTDEQ